METVQNENCVDLLHFRFYFLLLLKHYHIIEKLF